MTRRHEVDRELQALLKLRRIPVDEGRLERVREHLRRRGSRRERGRAPGFFPRHRLALSFGSALVLVGLILWQVAPGPQGPQEAPVASRLLEIVEDEGRMDQALVLLGGFASPGSEGDTLVEWEAYDRSLLGYYQEAVEQGNVLEALYGSS